MDSSGVTVSAPTMCSIVPLPSASAAADSSTNSAYRFGSSTAEKRTPLRERVRARAQPQVLAILPVHQVVLAAIAGPRPVRYLVVLEAGAAEAVLRPLVVLGLHIGIWRRHPAAGDVAGEGVPSSTVRA